MQMTLLIYMPSAELPMSAFGNFTFRPSVSYANAFLLMSSRSLLVALVPLYNLQKSGLADYGFR